MNMMIIVQQKLKAELEDSRQKCGELKKDLDRTDQRLAEYKVGCSICLLFYICPCTIFCMTLCKLNIERN